MQKETALSINGKPIFIYNVDKDDEILPLNFKGIDRFFRMLDKRGGRKAIGHAMVLFDGYNDIPQELNEIPEVRKFIQEMFNRYPHLLNYINFDMEGHVVLLTCLGDIEAVFVGERLTFDEHYAKYGNWDMPRYNVKTMIKQEKIKEILLAMVAHGSRVRGQKYAERQIEGVLKIFGKV